MFDLGFSELVVIAVVLLVVVGPERLPGVARTVGHLFGRMQRYISDVKADIRREVQFDELKKFQQQARELEQSVREEMGEIQSDVQQALSLPESETSEAAVLPEGADETADVGTQDDAQESQSGPEPDAPVSTAKMADPV
ncbi:MAG: Sec-independent protein translocase protein TatB [Azoarcus sp.]|jgi:sec-independent protein translocase protein TatB|nr:Sec-independent protein translocase protein TatB [Azoarcus sp.]